MCLQETWYAQQDLHALNSLHVDYHGFGKAPVNHADEIRTGRPYGGVAVLWRATLDCVVNTVDLDLD